MDYKKGIRLGTFYSELMHQEITIPKGFEATIEGNKIILAKTESEDERIRKALITFFQRFPYTNLYDNSLSAKNVIAWLEKQAQKEEHQIYKTKDGEIITYSEANGYKHVEPKFKIGDWIVYNRNDSSREILYVYDIRDGRYYFNDNIHFSWSIKECEEKCHLWSIEDAKDGDVLVDKDNNIGIFTRCEDIYWQSYIYLGCNGYLLGDSIGGSHEQTDTHPATKEQRDALMKAITEAVYTFDFEKKELKKIEPPPAWSEEDYNRISSIKYLLHELDNHNFDDWFDSLKERLGCKN